MGTSGDFVEEAINKSGSLGAAVEGEVGFKVADRFGEFGKARGRNIGEIGDYYVGLFGKSGEEVGFNYFDFYPVFGGIFLGDGEGGFGNIREINLIVGIQEGESDAEATGTSADVGNLVAGGRRTEFLDLSDDLLGFDSGNQDIGIDDKIAATKLSKATTIFTRHHIGVIYYIISNIQKAG